MTRIAARARSLVCSAGKRLVDIAAEGRSPICLLTLQGTRIDRVRPRAVTSDDLSGLDWAEGLERLGIDPDSVEDQVIMLVDQGASFRISTRSESFGLVCVAGWTEGLRARIALSRCTRLEAQLHQQLEQVREDLSALRDTGTRAESSPVPAIETDPEGRITWHNPAAERLLRRGVDRVTLARLEPGVRGARTQLLGSDGQAIGWARATTMPLPGGGKITHLEDINAQIEAESDLDSFMATLTETFAHLEQGLGIFDRDGKLTLFNPALAQMFSLDPALLARRPSLRQFLEALRQRRMVPEQRDYTDWRTRFIEASTAAGGAPLTQDWPLPSGCTLRVNVRRHPRGALAFIFQDISSQVLLETRYRSEIETTQATLEKLAEAVAVFGASGQLTYANRAFTERLGCGSMDALIGETIDTVCRAARRAGRDRGTWAALRRYVLSSEREGTWHGVGEDGGDGTSLLRASVLPDGSTLVTLDAAAPAGAESFDNDTRARA